MKSERSFPNLIFDCMLSRAHGTPDGNARFLTEGVTQTENEEQGGPPHTNEKAPAAMSHNNVAWSAGLDRSCDRPPD